MALRKSTQASLRAAALGALSASAVVPVVAEHVITTAANIAVNDVIEMLAWPAGHRIAGLHVFCDRIDSNGTPTWAADVGVLTGEWLQNTVGNDGTTARTCDQTFGAGLTTFGRNAGGDRVDLMTKAGALMAASNVDRSIGLKVTGTAATAVAGAKLGMIASFYPVPVGMASGS
jgi:hypothetical protein